MSYKEDFLSVLNGEKPKTFPSTEFMMFWPETIQAYKKYTQTEDLGKYFGLGQCYAIPCNFNPYPAFEEIILEEDERFITKIDATGVTAKIEKGTSAMPHYIDFPIKDRKTFMDFATRLDPMSEGRLEGLEDYIKYVKSNNCVTELVSRGPFAFLRDFINFEDLMMMFFDDPDLISEMTMFHAEFLVKLWSRVFEHIVPDIVYIGEDMAYKNASMISPAMVREFIYPAWQKIISFVKKMGVRHVILDSDGYTMDILPIAVEAGFTAILPMERAAGMDPEKVREQFPSLTLIGGVDKLQLAKGKGEIDAELDKICRVYEKGRYIPSCDHAVPPIIPYENYLYYITELRRRLK